MFYDDKVFGEIKEKRRHYLLIEWDVDFPAALRKKDCWYSPKFKFENEFFYIQIVPDHNDWVTMYLVLADCRSEFELTVHFTLGVKAADGTLHKFRSDYHSFDEYTEAYVWSQLVKNEDFLHQRSKLCPNGMVTVSCELRLNEECQADAQSQTLPYDDDTTLAQNLSNMYLKQKLCDVTISVRDRKYGAHRSILASRSTVFAAMFERDMKEKQSGVIKIDDCDPAAFDNFLLYLYTANVNIISSKNAIALYRIADKYDVSQLTSWCEKFLLTNLSVELFCDVLVLGMKYNKLTLIKAAEAFFSNNIEEILVSVKWQHFIKQNSTVANKLFIKYAQTLKRK